MYSTIHRAHHLFGDTTNGTSRTKGSGNYNMLSQVCGSERCQMRMESFRLIVGWGPKPPRSQRSTEQSVGSGLLTQALSFETTDQT